MSDPILAAIHAVLSTDTDVDDALGRRLYDRVPDRARAPYLTYGPIASLPLDAEGVEAHDVTLEVWSRARGRAEAASALHAVANALDGAALLIDGHRCIDCRVTARETRAQGLELYRGALRLRVVTESQD